MTTVYVTPDHDTSMVSSPTEEVDTYNGWANYETWNVALWIGNDEELYRLARQCRHYRNPYQNFIAMMEGTYGITRTPDGVKWIEPLIDEDEINEMIREL